MKKIKLAPHQTTRILIVGLSLVALLLVGNLILKRVHRLVTDQTLPPLPNPEIQIAQPNPIELGKINVRVEIGLPDRISVFQAIRPPALGEICRTIATQRQLDYSQKYQAVEIWKNAGESLYCTGDKLSWKREGSFMQPPDLEKSKQNTLSFLKTIGLESSTFTTPTAEYFNEEVGTMMSANPPGEIIGLTYTSYLDQYEIYQKTDQTKNLIAYTDQTNTPFKLEYSHSYLAGKNIGQYPVMNKTEIEKQLKEGSGVITQALIQSDQGDYSSPATDIATLESAALLVRKIVYAYSENEQLLVPCFLVSGHGLTKTRQAIDLELLLPAIDPRYLEGS